MAARTSTARRTTRVDSRAVVRAALVIADEEGVDSLSMRRLAADMGIGTMTLYGHFRSKRELLDATIDLAAEDFEAPDRAGPPRDQLRDYARAAHEWLIRHPSLVQIRGEDPIVRPAAFRISEIGMRILLDAGVPASELAYVFRLLFTYVFGAVAFGFGEPTPEQRRATAAAVIALPPQEFPALVAASSAAGAALGGTGPFEFGLELVLDGIEKRFPGAQPS